MSESARRRIVLPVAALLFIAAAFFSTRLKINEDITQILPDNDPMVADFRLVVKNFQALDFLYIDIAAPNPTDDSTGHLVAASDHIAETLKSSGLFTTVVQKTTPAQMLAVDAAIGRARASLLDADDLRTIETRLSGDALNERIALAKRMLSEPSGSFMMDRIRRDPLGISELALGKLSALAPSGSSASGMDGRLWSADGTHTLIIAAPSFPSLDTVRGEELETLLNRTVAEAHALSGGQTKITIFGGHPIALDNARAMKSDIMRTMIVINVVIAVMGFLVFRHRAFPPMVFLPAAFGIVFGAGALALMGGSVSGLALGCGASLIGITVDYGIQILYRLDSEDLSRKSALNLARPLALPLALASGTTFLSFITLESSSLPGQRQLGIFSAAGVAGSVLFAIAVLPLLIFGPLRKATARRVIPIANLLSRFLDFRRRREGLLLTLLGVVLAVSAFGISRLKFEGDFRRLNHMLPERIEAEAMLRRTWGDFGGSSIVTRGATREEAIRAAERVATALAELRAKGAVKDISTVAGLLPSEETQKRNAESWKSFWSASRIAAARTNITAAAATQSFAPAAFEPFITSLAEPQELLRITDFDGTPVSDLLRTRIVEREGEHSVLTLFTPASGADKAAIRASIIAAAPTAILLDLDEFVAHTQTLSLKELRNLAIGAAIATAVILAVLLPWIELQLIVFLPVLLGAFITLGVMGIAGIPINIVSSIFVVYVFGTGIDYSIYLVTSSLTAHRDGHAEKSSAAGAMVLCAIATLAGFGAMCIAQHPAVHSIGATGFLGIGWSAICALILVPALTERLFRREPGGGAFAFASALRRLSVNEDQRAQARARLVSLYAYAGKFAEGYVAWKTRLDPLSTRVPELIGDSARVLDLGCGYGISSLGIALRNPDAKVVGIDFDAAKIARAQTASFGMSAVQFHVGEFRKEELQTANAVLLIDVLHYWSPADQRAALAKACAAVAPGGMLLFRDAIIDSAGHAPTSLAEKITTALRINRPGAGLHFQTSEFYREAFAASGMTIAAEHPELAPGSNVVWILRKK